MPWVQLQGNVETDKSITFFVLFLYQTAHCSCGRDKARIIHNMRQTFQRSAKSLAGNTTFMQTEETNEYFNLAPEKPDKSSAVTFPTHIKRRQPFSTLLL